MSTDQSTIDHYNQNAEAYDQHVSNASDSPYHSMYEKPAIRGALPDLHGLDVLSVGCGSGVDTKWLKDNGAERAVGIDISSGLIELAKQHYPELEFYEMDMETLSFDDASFDLLYSSLAIHYLDDWTAALNEATRVLKPGGTYVFSCNHPIETALEHREDDRFSTSVIGRETEKSTNTRKVYGDYLAARGDGTKRISTRVNGMDVIMYHKTFGAMIDEITRSGFRIDRIIEPQPLNEMESADPKHYEQLTRVPSFMAWVLQKPL